MKVGIITIIDNNNYGNRLQNYALSEVLKKINSKIDVITIKNEPYRNIRRLYFLRKLKYRKILGTYSNYLNRMESFKKFNKNICFSKYYINPFYIKEKFDYFIVGSDQVWNPNFGRFTDVDLISFEKNNTKKISYAASFGINTISQRNEKKVRKYLSKFKAISVREDAGKNILNHVIVRNDIEVVLDPTMLLTAEEWDKVSTKPQYLKCKKYILTYFLGGLSEARKREIENIAKVNECEIINILDKESVFYNCGPSEFLYLEKNAFLICTDSFHSSVFAILYNRPFVIFDREENGIENMNSRLDTLISKFQLKNRKYNGFEITKENLEPDYSEVYKILDNERKKSNCFLKKALNIKE